MKKALLCELRFGRRVWLRRNFKNGGTGKQSVLIRRRRIGILGRREKGKDNFEVTFRRVGHHVFIHADDLIPL